jgi:multimeric flavodoxin WrbA
MSPEEDWNVNGHSLPHILILNGSLGGPAGNTAAVLQPLIACLAARCSVESVHLATDTRTPPELESLLLRADGFVFASGTYWDSWGSPLQRFLEQSTHLEASSVWLGKPAAVVVTMHVGGGKGVLSRLQGVLSTLGLLIPPMTGFLYSLACHLAMGEAPASTHLGDFWQMDDLQAIAHNLLEAAAYRPQWKTWIIDRQPPDRRWMPGSVEPLTLGRALAPVPHDQGSVTDSVSGGHQP